MYQTFACERDIYENITYAGILYEQQKETVKKEQYIENVLLDAYVKAVRIHQTRYDYVPEIINNAQHEVGNKKKSDRKNLDLVSSWISSDFLSGQKIKIKRIASGGYENYSWSVYFDLYGEELEICIPIKRNITSENFHYANYGAFVVFLKEGSCSWSAMVKSYKIEEIAKFFKEWMKLKDGEKKDDQKESEQ